MYEAPNIKRRFLVVLSFVSVLALVMCLTNAADLSSAALSLLESAVAPQPL